MPVDHGALILGDPNACHGQATVKGTRVMVSVVPDVLADGMTEAETMGEYPTLAVEEIRAATAYRADLARDECPAVSTSWMRQRCAQTTTRRTRDASGSDELG